MDKIKFAASLRRAFEINGMSELLTESVAEKFTAFADYLITENEKYNLTAIRDEAGIALLHFADCAALCRYIPENATLCDVGCGAGFPSIPVAILRPDVCITAIDSTAKRVNFVNTAAELLELKNLTAEVSRAEDFARVAGRRESFDTVTARAVSALPTLSELCLPLVRVGGIFLSMKGKSAPEELSQAKRAIELLGGKGATLDDISLFGYEGERLERAIISIPKKAKSEQKYPRNYSQIQKKPL